MVQWLFVNYVLLIEASRVHGEKEIWYDINTNGECVEINVIIRSTIKDFYMLERR